MSIQAAYVVPHPPLIIPSVGRGEERGIQKTIDAYRTIAKRIVGIRPEVIVISSPHVPLYRDAFHVTTDTVLSGSMEAFRAPQTRLSVDVDTALSQALIKRAQRSDLMIAPSTWRDHEMDHATFIPLYFINEAYKEANVEPDYRVVRVGLSGLSSETHRIFGHIISDAIDQVDTRCVYIASGDLSHKLKADGPYGFAPEGPQLDCQLCKMFASGKLEELFELDEYFCDCAAECGVRSFQIMAGALEMQSIKLKEPCSAGEESGNSKPDDNNSLLENVVPSFGAYLAELLSYEGPFGVGYAVAAFERSKFEAASKSTNKLDSRELLKDLTASDSPTDVEDKKADPYVALARASVEAIVRTGKPLKLSDYLYQHIEQGELPEEMLNNRAGVFVSIHEWGELRGCIGTIVPTTACIAEEIIQNAISASMRDPRFPAIEVGELGYLEISVDVLGETEPVSSAKELDPKRYGVIVTKGFRRGLLLPNLDGVNTVEDQVTIAKQKAGIRVSDTDVELERFEVIRHE